MPASLSERDPVQCGVELPVAGAAKSVSGLVRRPDRQGCSAVVAGVGVAGLEPIDAGGLADDLGGGKRPTARQGEEGRRQLLGELGDLLGQLLDADGELDAAFGQVAGQPSDDPGSILKPHLDPGQGARGIQTPSLRLPPGIKFVQIPAESADQPGSLCHKGFPMVNQQPKLPVWTIEAGDRKVGFPLRGTGYRERVDRVGLAIGAG